MYSKGWYTVLTGRLSGVFEQETEGLFGLNVRGNAPQGTILLEAHLRRRHRLALRSGQPLDLAIHFVARGPRWLRAPRCARATSTP